MYEDWARAHGVSVNSLLVLAAVYEGMEDEVRSAFEMVGRSRKINV